MKHINQIIKNRTVNGLNKDTTTVNSVTVNSKGTIKERLDELIADFNAQPEELAKILAEEFDDNKSITYYTLLAKNNSAQKIFEALSITRDAHHRGKIKTKKLFYFKAILSHWGLKIKFKKDT